MFRSDNGGFGVGKIYCKLICSVIKWDATWANTISHCAQCNGPTFLHTSSPRGSIMSTWRSHTPITQHQAPPWLCSDPHQTRENTDALQACLMVALIIHFTIIPRPFQLQASLSILNRQDSIITAGTGSGKTLCLLIPISLRPNSISITISPLKQLQVTQVRVEHVYHYYNTWSSMPAGCRVREVWNQDRRNQWRHIKWSQALEGKI